MKRSLNSPRVVRALAGVWLAACVVACGPGVHGPAACGAEDLDLLEQRAFQAAVQRVAGSVVRIETVGGLERVDDVLFGSGAASGLVIDADGHILTSAFALLNRPASILVQLPDGTRHPARLVATDHNRMVVLLKIDTDRPLPVPEAVPREQMRVGAWAIAVGRTFEVSRPNMAVGILSAVNRIWGKAIQTDAAVSPSNYGGPLVDIHGRVLGVLVPLSPQRAEEIAGVQWYDSGIGFAVPLCDLAEVVAQLKQGKDLYPGVMGIGFPQDSLYTANTVIAVVRRGSPAAKAGLAEGDRIVEIGGRPISRAAEAKEEISRRYAGQKVRVVVLRKEERIERGVELVAKLDPYARPFLGFLPMRSAKAEDGAATPVSVRYVYPGGPAATAGVEPGDVLVRFGETLVESAESLRRRVAERKPGETIELVVRRGPASHKLSVHLARLPETLPPASLPAAYVDDTGPRELAAEGDKKPKGAKKEEAGKKKKAVAGLIRLKIPKFENDARAYVPEDYHRGEPLGVVVWLHSPGGLDLKPLVAGWKPHCDRDRFILVAPAAADPDEWQPREVELVGGLIEEIDSHYTIDRTRVAVCGQEVGGTLAYLVAFGRHDLVRAVAAVDGAPAGRPLETGPAEPLAFYVARSAKSRFAGRIEEGVQRLRSMGYPVTVKDLGESPRSLESDELAELIRWIDMLDRI